MIEISGLTRAMKRFLKWLWFGRSALPLLDIPVPWPLPYGGVFLAHGDVVGLNILTSRILGKSENSGEWRFIQRYLQGTMICFDIGANQGFFTILASRRLQNGGRIIAFEPSPREFDRLRRNVALNRCRNVTLEKRAVGSRDRNVHFHMCLGHQGAFSSLKPQALDVIARRRTIEVPMVTLDSYLSDRGIDRVDFIKVDVEGGEMDVLKGATGVLAGRRRPVWMCEVEDVRTSPWGYNADEICEFLGAHGYEWFSITPSGGLDVIRKGNRHSPNLIAVPYERLSEIRAEPLSTH